MFYSFLLNFPNLFYKLLPKKWNEYIYGKALDYICLKDDKQNSKIVVWEEINNLLMNELL